MSEVQTHALYDDRVAQGDIFRRVEYIEYIREEAGQIEVGKIVFPAVVVLTQDCDLSQDHRVECAVDAKSHDKRLISVLVAPLYNEEHIYEGSHLEHLGMIMQKISRNKTPGEFLRQNSNPRYHYLKFGPDVDLVDSVVDFKHYFSVSLHYLRERKSQSLVCSLAPLFRESVVQRFAAFLSRIGLPEPLDVADE